MRFLLLVVILILLTQMNNSLLWEDVNILRQTRFPLTCLSFWNNFYFFTILIKYSLCELCPAKMKLHHMAFPFTIYLNLNYLISNAISLEDKPLQISLLSWWIETRHGNIYAKICYKLHKNQPNNAAFSFSILQMFECCALIAFSLT